MKVEATCSSLDSHQPACSDNCMIIELLATLQSVASKVELHFFRSGILFVTLVPSLTGDLVIEQ
jgi:hypothetical protein